MASVVSVDGTSFELAEPETLLGRGGREMADPPKVDVGPLEGGATVSRYHARIIRKAGRWHLRVEPTARNATLVAGQHIPAGEEVSLSDNAAIQLGDVALTFKGPPGVDFAPDSTMAEMESHTVSPEAVAPVPAAPPIVAPAPLAGVAPSAAQATTTQGGKGAWPARLPGRPATLAALGITEFKRVNPFRGLMIDEAAWADAHDYHRLQARLHLLSAHGWGIVEGLEVVADGQVPNTLVIRPGIAVDAQGRALLVPQERRLAVSADQPSTLYVTLRMNEELAQPQRSWSDLDEYTRVVERCEALVQRIAPTPPALELARVVVSGPVRNASDPIDPRPGEIDLRFREKLLARPRPELAVAQLLLAGGEEDSVTASHRLGLRYLLREIGLTTAYRPRWAGAVRLDEPLPPVSLLYLSTSGAFTVGDGTVEALRGFLEGGGALFADGCQEGKAADFLAAARGLADRLGCSLQPVARHHPVLTARHLFAEPPITAKDASLAEGGGLIVSTADFGCAWQGGSAKQPLPREAIRNALELGVNVAVYARQRLRPLEVIELET